ncbi:hypothetical protein FQV39_04310 [Bosea sp. F3-2]|uniref:hypothetical protein n=1 Tax=Bosea sp. F3-2 TaxID=2599640 RepID=UPI0011EEFB7F|nr:hypothetical protein [Bosea sp. F3-2]QEL21887.1 hypothetical protein FQV39_04310 [Bosea sp. F3-2]
MTPILNISALSRRLPASVRLAGLAVLAGLTYGAAMAPPAAAAPMPDWRASCEFKAAPQGYGESMRYTNCMHQNECQRMANAAGTTIYTAGCFGVAPDAPAAPAAPASGRR